MSTMFDDDGEQNKLVAAPPIHFSEPQKEYLSHLPCQFQLEVKTTEKICVVINSNQNVLSFDLSGHVSVNNKISDQGDLILKFEENLNFEEIGVHSFVMKENCRVIL